MSENVDRILGVIDGGLQSTTEPAYTQNPALCWRCEARAPDESFGSGLCSRCRAFLLEEAVPPEGELFVVSGPVTAADLETLGRALEQIVDAIRPIVDAMVHLVEEFLEVLAPVLEWLGDEARRAPTRARTLPHRRRATIAPPRDLRITESRFPPLPPIRRKTP